MYETNLERLAVASERCAAALETIAAVLATSAFERAEKIEAEHHEILKMSDWVDWAIGTMHETLVDKLWLKE